MELDFFTLLELRLEELLELFVLFLTVLLRGLTVPLDRLVVVPLRVLRLVVASLRARVELLRVLPRELVPVEFQTRVLRLRCWTDLLSLEVLVRCSCTFERLLVAVPLVLLEPLALLPTVVGVVRLVPRLPVALPPTRVVPRQLLVLSLTGTRPAWRPSPAEV